MSDTKYKCYLGHILTDEQVDVRRYIGSFGLEEMTICKICGYQAKIIDTYRLIFPNNEE